MVTQHKVGALSNTGFLCEKKSDVRDLDGTAAVLFLLFRVSAGVRL